MLSVRPLVATKWGLSRISPGACVVGRALIRRRACAIGARPTTFLCAVGAPQARRRCFCCVWSSGCVCVVGAPQARRRHADSTPPSCRRRAAGAPPTDSRWWVVGAHLGRHLPHSDPTANPPRTHDEKRTSNLPP